MSRAHLPLLSSLLVAALAFPAGAQTPTDSAASDSAPPKKTSRFGGLMNKAKQVAGNKAVQGAVKGAATNVACTVVPGAAVASAVTGSGPCQNTLMGGLMSGKGIAGAATNAASGAAAGVAAKAMGKMGGTTGAAAAGALGTMGGVSGMSKAAAAAAAGAMLPKGGAAGMPNAAAMAAAQAAAARMMATGGALPSMAGMPGMPGTTAGGKKIETVDFRELKGLLPESLRGMKRTAATGEKNAAMGIQISSAEGTYSSEDGKSVTLKIADIGSINGMAGMATYAWASTEIDRESDGGYEKSTTFKGFKALEKYNKQSRSGELSILVGGRFIVEADGNNIDMDALKSALGSVDLRKLDGMKGKGVH